MKIKWYHIRNMSGAYLSPLGWVNYCNKLGWEHLWYVITWNLYRKRIKRKNLDK